MAREHHHAEAAPRAIAVARGGGVAGDGLEAGVAGQARAQQRELVFAARGVAA
jgi:hypothetical protein